VVSAVLVWFGVLKGLSLAFVAAASGGTWSVFNHDACCLDEASSGPGVMGRCHLFAQGLSVVRIGGCSRYLGLGGSPGCGSRLGLGFHEFL
jgi:hypothetical protein